MKNEKHTRKEIIDLRLKKAGWLVTDNGALSKKNLIESPFTLLHPEGIRGVFNPNEIDEILKFTVKLTAA